MKTFITLFILLIIIIAVCFWFISSPINPKSYKTLSTKSFSTPLIEVSKLATMGPLPGFGPEDITFDTKGNLYTGLANGNIVKIDQTTQQQQIIAHVPGRPLGLDIWQQSKLLVCVVGQGVYQIDLQTNKIEHLINYPFGFEEEIAATPNKIYITDGSKYNILIPRQQLFEALEHGGYGRIWEYDVINKKLQLLANNIQFANGIALNSDKSFLVISDMFNFRLLKYDLHKKIISNFIDGLPGYPDNISLGTDNLFWIAIYSPPIKILNKLAKYPLIRKIAAQLPLFLLPHPKQTSWIMAVDQYGKIVKIFKIKQINITSVIEYKEQLYIGTLNQKYIYIYHL